MTIVSLEELIISQESLIQRVELLKAGLSDLMEALTEARETINSLGNLVESSHMGAVARISQLERQQTRHSRQLDTIPTIAKRLTALERNVNS